MNALERVIMAGLLMLASFMAGEWRGSHRARPINASPAPAVRQNDGSLILERNPERPRPQLPQIPKGAKVERVTTITIAPRPDLTEGNPTNQAQTVQLTQIETAEGSRVIASTPDGQIIGGADWTTPRQKPPKVPRWEFQAVRGWQPSKTAWGASLGYARGPFVASVTAIPGLQTVAVGIGFRW